MNFNAFDLNLLRVLDALLAENSTTLAAKRVGLSQPAVSSALGRLRDALGDELFVRRGQGLVPTDYARAIALPLRETLDRMEGLLTAPRQFDPARASETFRLAGIDFFAEMLMPGLATELARDAPGVRLQLLNLVPRVYEETLERYEVDIALFPLTDSPEWADHRLLFRSPFVVVAARDNPHLAGIAPGGEIPMDVLCSLSHVLFSVDGELRAMVDTALEAVGRSRRVVMSMASFAGIFATVARSELVTLAPVQLARRYAERGLLNLYEPPLAIPAPIIGMMWHRRSAATPAHRWLRARIAANLVPLNAGLEPLRAR